MSELGKFSVTLSFERAPYRQKPRKPKAAYSKVIAVIPTFKTPNRAPNDFGVFMLFSSATTTPTASMANNVVPKKSGNSAKCGLTGSYVESLSASSPSNTYFNINAIPVQWNRREKKRNAFHQHAIKAIGKMSFLQTNECENISQWRKWCQQF